MVLSDPDEPLDPIGEGERNVDVHSVRVQGVTRLGSNAADTSSQSFGLSNDRFHVDTGQDAGDL